MSGKKTRFPDYTASFTEPVICVKPGRSLLLKLCTALLCLIGVPAVGVMLWAEGAGFNLNRLPWLPRIALAAVAVGCAYGIYASVQEAQVRLVLACYRDRLTLTWENRPALWREGNCHRVAEVRYDDVKQCICSRSRMRVTLTTSGYSLTEGEQPPRHKTGAVAFSTLGANATDFAALLEKHTPLKVLTKQ
jgi:hypothetical protein